MSARCPCCRRIIGAAGSEKLQVDGGLPRGWQYFAAVCRYCGAILALIPFPVKAFRPPASDSQIHR